MTAAPAAAVAAPHLPRLLAGPRDREPLAAHLARLGDRGRGGPWLVETLARAGVRGRGGAGFPTARKWAAVAERARGGAVVLVNAAEGEPLSSKDRLLLTLRPHLVLDGAALAAETVAAREVVVYLNRLFGDARRSLESALAERRGAGERVAVRLVDAPPRFVAGEETAAVRRVDGGPAQPTFIPRRPFERGVGGRPTLVQNVETLAHVALAARFGDAWFRSLGTADDPGTLLLTVSGAVARPGVVEAACGSPTAGVVEAAGGAAAAPGAVLVGGFAGVWVSAADAWPLPLDASALARFGAAPGCGALMVLPTGACGLLETARILRYLAAESAGQCGPCVHGLDAVAAALERVAARGRQPRDVDRLVRWAGQVDGRGACHHPDGAVRLLRSALHVFAADLAHHTGRGPCAGVHAPSVLPPLRPGEGGWR